MSLLKFTHNVHYKKVRAEAEERVDHLASKTENSDKRGLASNVTA
jgi:hypothetical protein